MDDESDSRIKSRADAGFTPIHVDMLLFAVMLSMSAAILAYGPRNPASAPRSRSHAAAENSRLLPPTPVPAVEPVAFVDMTPDQARDYNATIPFSDEHIKPARPFAFQGSPADRENALTCLASAAWYEAGDDKIGEQAVAQVVLNRVRHPAFPKTVCAVVFEGSDRKTGCQFTFTCDGSLVRIPPPVQWQRAREVAEKSLSGFVFKPIGTATHYHTDWVVPYWASSLDKLTEVHTHIFYRWTGWWGLPQAFSGTLVAPESIDPRIVALSHQVAAAGPIAGGSSTAPDSGGQAPNEQPTVRIDGVADNDLKGNIVRFADPDHGLFVLLLDPKAYAGSYAVAALAICRSRPTCRVLGWLRSASMPDALPLDQSKIKSAVFRYQKAGGLESAQWDCRVVQRTIDSQCLPGTGLDRSGDIAAKDR